MKRSGRLYGREVEPSRNPTHRVSHRLVFLAPPTRRAVREIPRAEDSPLEVSAAAPATTSDPAAQRGSLWVIPLCSTATRRIVSRSSRKRTPIGAARMALPFPAYGAGRPASSHIDPREQSLGGRASPRSGTDRTPALEQVRRSADRSRPDPIRCSADTAEELTGELRVVAVLAEREVRDAIGYRRDRLASSPRRRRRRFPVAPPRRRSRRIAERLAEEAAGQRVGRVRGASGLRSCREASRIRRRRTSGASGF